MKNVIQLRFDINDESYLIPTYKDGNLVINRRVQNFKQLENQQGLKTKIPFRVPISDEIINAIGDVTDLSQSPKVDIRKSITGSIESQGVTIYEGAFQILNIYTNPKEVEIIFQGEETSLKSITKDITLAELFEGELIPYNAEYIRDSFNNNLTNNNYTYAIIDYGQNITSNNIVTLKQTDYKPTVSFRKILSMLNEVEGISVEIDADYEEEFINQNIPLHNNNNQTPTVDTSQLDNTGSISYASDSFLINLSSATTVILPIAGGVVANYNTIGFNVSRRYVVNATGTHKFSINITINIDPPTPYSDAIIGGIVFGYEIQSVGVFVPISVSYSTRRLENFSRTFSFPFNLDLDDGDVVIFQLNIQQTVAISVDYEIASGSSLKCIESPVFNEFTNVVVSKNFVEGMNVWDHCIATLIKQLNGIIVKENDSYTIIPWVKWITTGETIDINDIVDSSQSIEIQPPSTTGVKSISFDYLEDTDFYNNAVQEQLNQNYGSLLIEDTGVDFSSSSVEVKIPFAPTPIVPVSGTDLAIPKFVDDDFNTVKTKPRLLKFNGIKNQFVIVTDSFDPLSTFSNTFVPNFGEWESLAGGFNTNCYNFGTTINFFNPVDFPNNNLYKRFWEEYVSSTYGFKSRLLVLKTNFNKTQAVNFKLNDTYFYKNQLFRIISIDGIDLTNSSSPQTVKMALVNTIYNPEIAPYYPFDSIDSVIQWKDSSTNVSVGDGSGEPAADIEASANAYGYDYDANENRAIQLGGIIVS